VKHKCKLKQQNGSFGSALEIWTHARMWRKAKAKKIGFWTHEMRRWALAVSERGVSGGEAGVRWVRCECADIAARRRGWSRSWGRLPRADPRRGQGTPRAPTPPLTWMTWMGALFCSCSHSYTLYTTSHARTTSLYYTLSSPCINIKKRWHPVRADESVFQTFIIPMAEKNHMPRD
jgi:hypothetical protein